MRISVVVPTLDEPVSPPEGFEECIAVQGGIREVSVGGALLLPSARGRSTQMNSGARAATGDVLLFLHADTRLPKGASGAIRRAVGAGAVGGCFETAFDPPHFVLRMGDIWRNLRSRYAREFYGDQSIFIRRDLFERVGGYRPMAHLEDYDLCLRMLGQGRVVHIGRRALTSARRYLRDGILRTWIAHQVQKVRFELQRL